MILAKVRRIQRLETSTLQSTSTNDAHIHRWWLAWWHTENGMIGKPAQSEMAYVYVDG